MPSFVFPWPIDHYGYLQPSTDAVGDKAKEADKLTNAEYIAIGVAVLSFVGTAGNIIATICIYRGNRGQQRRDEIQKVAAPFYAQIIECLDRDTKKHEPICLSYEKYAAFRLALTERQAKYADDCWNAHKVCDPSNNSYRLTLDCLQQCVLLHIEQ